MGGQLRRDLRRTALDRLQPARRARAGQCRGCRICYEFLQAGRRGSQGLPIHRSTRRRLASSSGSTPRCSSLRRSRSSSRLVTVSASHHRPTAGQRRNGQSSRGSSCRRVVVRTTSYGRSLRAIRSNRIQDAQFPIGLRPRRHSGHIREGEGSERHRKGTSHPHGGGHKGWVYEGGGRQADGVGRRVRSTIAESLPGLGANLWPGQRFVQGGSGAKGVRHESGLVSRRCMAW